MKLSITFVAKCDMMTIVEFMDLHPMISISGIERELGLTKGTLRKGKEVPEKYRERIIVLLEGYGYNNIGSMKEKEEEVVSDKRVVYKIGKGMVLKSRNEYDLWVVAMEFEEGDEVYVTLIKK